MRWAGFDAGGVDTGFPLLGSGAGCGGSGFRSLAADGTGCGGGGGAGSHGSWVTLSPESFFCHSYRSVRTDDIHMRATSTSSWYKKMRLKRQVDHSAPYGVAWADSN